MKSLKWKTVIRGRSDTAVADDRVLPLTRWVARFIVPFLVGAFIVLYGMPGRTTEFFAWTIRPEMTPIIMGAGYGAGTYFFYRVSTAKHWHTVAPVFLGIAAFTWLMTIATAIHWENFNHSHDTFYLWVALYAITPLLIPGIWALNQRTEPDELTPDVAHLPRGVRLAGGALGIVVTVSAVGLFIVPGIGAWPWTVSPFTARILAGWLALLGIVNTVAVRDSRWRAARILVQSQLLGFTLVLLGVVRSWDNFDPTDPLTWGFIGGTLVYLSGLLALYIGMERR